MDALLGRRQPPPVHGATSYARAASVHLANHTVSEDALELRRPSPIRAPFQRAVPLAPLPSLPDPRSQIATFDRAPIRSSPQ
jgi:hypothetical protein